MAKKASLFECQACGFQSTKWVGRCSNCGSWESFLELNSEQIKVLKESTTTKSATSKPLPITEISHEEISRFSSFEDELDLVLGGGIVPGSLVLIGGSPGVGKSTLLLKIAGNLAQNGNKVLYVSGEESLSQIKSRASRIGSLSDNLFMLSEIKLESITPQVTSGEFGFLVIDSIQTIYSERLPSAPGSVTQVREITFELMRKAKDENIAIFIIGHITKEGSIAGPRVLEHMVDTVLYFEGDVGKELRMLRAFKNRFGTTSEIGIFEMSSAGLVSAKDAANSFFSKKASQAGSAITVILEGSRAILLEVQALVSQCSYGYPKRSSTGFDTNRLNMLLALLERKLELPLNSYDVFINIAGGFKISETSADLAIIAAIISSFRNRPLSNETVFIGEVSLTGDIREISNIELRLKEAFTHGFKKAIIPKKPKSKPNIKCFELNEVEKLIEWM